MFQNKCSANISAKTFRKRFVKYLSEALWYKHLETFRCKRFGNMAVITFQKCFCMKIPETFPLKSLRNALA